MRGNEKKYNDHYRRVSATYQSSSPPLRIAGNGELRQQTKQWMSRYSNALESLHYIV